MTNNTRDHDISQPALLDYIHGVMKRRAFEKIWFLQQALIPRENFMKCVPCCALYSTMKTIYWRNSSLPVPWFVLLRSWLLFPIRGARGIKSSGLPIFFPTKTKSLSDWFFLFLFLESNLLRMHIRLNIHIHLRLHIHPALPFVTAAKSKTTTVIILTIITMKCSFPVADIMSLYTHSVWIVVDH